MLVARIYRVAAILFWGAEKLPAHTVRPVTGPASARKWGGRLSFFFKSLVIVADGHQCHG